MKETTTPQRKRILAAAAKLFQRQGYPATSVRTIALEVGLGASSLYNHIAGKQELLQEICFLSAQRFEEGISLLEKQQISGPALLKGVIHLHVSLALQHPETVTVFNDEWRHLEQPQLSEFLRKRKEYEGRFSALLQNGIASGEFIKHDMAVAVPTLLASLSWIYQLSKPEQREAESLTAEIFALWSRGWLQV